MKTQFLAAALVGLAAATPVEKRQLGGGDGDELRDGDCQDVTFIFARASTEQGLMGSTLGPMVCSGLKDELQSVACQGVGPKYTAGIAENALPKGTSDVAIEEAKSLFEMAHTKCPETKIVAGGYSQGCAVMHGAIPELEGEIKDQVQGVVLFGDTRNKQDDGQIPDFPPDKTDIICATGDLVCEGQLIVGFPHFSYFDDVPKAVDFLLSHVQ